MSCLKEFVEKICGVKKDDEVLKHIEALVTKENNDLAKVIVKSCTKIELKKLENELEKSKSCNNMWSQIAKYIAIVIITSIFVYNKDTIVDIIQASKTSTTITTTLDCNKTIDSNDTTNHKSTTDCNQTYSKRSDVK